MTDLIPTLIEETRNLWNQGKKVMIQVAYNLAQIQQSDDWKSYETFPAFCEAELDIRRSTTSKLLTIANYYLKEFSPEQIGDSDYEKLYAASMLPGSVEENLSRARTWSRDDFKDDKKETCAVHEYEPFCKHCWKKQP